MKQEFSFCGKTLAAALCVSLAASPVAAQAGKTGPGFGGRNLQAGIPAALDAHFPSRAFFPIAALEGLCRAAQVEDDVMRRESLTFLLHAVSEQPDRLRARLESEDFPEDVIRRLVETSSYIRTQSETDPELASLLGSIVADRTPQVLSKPRTETSSKIASLLQRTVFALGSSRDGGLSSSLAIAGDPLGAGLRGMSSDPNKRDGIFKSLLRPFRSHAEVLDAAGLLNLVPSSGKIAALEKLAKENPDAALKQVTEILKDDRELRIEMRLAALRVMSQMDVAKTAPMLISAIGNNLNNAYIKREAARMIGQRAAQFSDLDKSAAIEVLETLSRSNSMTLRLMARWSLARFGVNTGPDSDAVQREPTLRKSPESPTPVRPDSSGGRQWRLISQKWASIVMALWVGFLAAFLLFAPERDHVVSPPLPPIVTVSPSHPETAQDVPESDMEKLRREVQRSADAQERTAKALEENNERLQKASKSGESSKLWPMLLLSGLIILFISLFRRMKGSAGGAGTLADFGKVKVKMEKPATIFSDIAGIDDALLEVREIKDFLEHPGRYRNLGARMPKGVLLVGPPGTGKTLLARAVAGETGAAFLPISGSNFVEMFVGVGAARVRDLFEQAAKHAPAIIFIDEIDAVGKSRSGGSGVSGGNDEREQTLNQILTMMDGFDNSKGILVLAATNRADTLDPALLRPGRFDRRVYTGNPDVRGREAILSIHAKDVPLAPEADLQFIAQRTAGLAGAHLANIVNEAALLAARHARKMIEPDDLNRAINRAVAGIERNITLSETERRRVAIHESGHVLAGVLGAISREDGLKMVPNTVTIIPHGDAALGFADHGTLEDKYLHTQSELEARLTMIIGGLAAERLVTGQHSSGPANDLEKASEIARAMVEKLGMGSQDIGIESIQPDKGYPLGGRRTSETTARLIDLEVKEILDKAMERTKRLLHSNRRVLDAMVRALLEKETLVREEIQDIIQSP